MAYSTTIYEKVSLYVINSRLYESLEESKVSIFESPTGTGKSLSIICGALKWLKNYQNKSIDAQIEEIINQQSLDEDCSNDNQPSWVKQFALAKKREMARIQVTDAIERNKQRLEKLAQLKRLSLNKIKIQNGQFLKRKKAIDENCETDYKTSPDSFLVDDYDSEPDDNAKILEKSVLEELNNDTDKDLANDSNLMQIFYCSRTHSQLTQFINEIRKTAYKDMTCITLGSRKNLCINPQVSKLSSLPRINDKCLDLQKDKKDGCSFLCKDPNSKQDFINQAHVEIKDIEELAKLGEKMNICPYYGSRSAISTSDIVVLPYNLILQKSARESLGIDLKNKIIIFDEAHNIIETLSSIYSVSVDKSCIERAKMQLENYFKKYKSKLLGKNIAYIRQIQCLLEALLNHFEKNITKKNAEMNESIKNVNDFVHDLDIDHLNIFKIEIYLKESRLAQKLHGFVLDTRKDQENNLKVDAPFTPKHLSSLQQVQAFLMSLTNSEINGRVITSFNGITGESSLKYLLLNPEGSFKDIVNEARSVVLAGGTMEPHQDIIQQLYPHVPKSRLDFFSCGHVVPKTSLLTLSIGYGPSQNEFNFNFENRMNKLPIEDLGIGISSLCDRIPGGAVCFFVSYAYLDHVYSIWKSCGILKQIGEKKRVFVEPKHANESDKVLKQYEHHIQSKQSPKGGALLLAIVGGKMSEGINFSDDLGRGVIIVGLPFPNLKSLEMKEKMDYMNLQGENNGQEYYENLCMRAVNQSIGRAIRHINDYAVIALIDKRYSKSKITAKLPGWIRDAGIVVPLDFSEGLERASQFFQRIKR